MLLLLFPYVNRVEIKQVLQGQKVQRPVTRDLPSRKSANIEHEERRASRDEQDPIPGSPGILQCRSPG
jgi:hypothetical protein